MSVEATSSTLARRQVRERWANVNGAAAVASRIVNYGTRVAIVPLGLASLGVEGYGSWQALAALLSWMGLDFGVSAGLTTLAGELDARSATQELKRIISATVVAFALLGVGIFAVLCVWAWGGGVNGLLYGRLRGGALDDAIWTVIVCGFLYAVSAPAKAVAAVAMGVNLGYLDSVVNAVAGMATLAWIFLQPKPTSILVFGLASILPLVVAYGAGAVALFGSLRPELRPTLGELDGRAVGVLLRRSGPFWLFQTADLALLHAGNLLLAGTMGPEMVPVYATCVSLYAFVPNIISAFVAPYLPAFCGAVANADWDWIVGRTWRNLLLFGAVAGGVAILLTLAAQVIVAYWSGGRLHAPLGLAVALGVASVFTTLNSGVSVVLLGVGAIWAKTVAKCVAALVFVLSGWYLSGLQGVTGMGVALAVAGAVEVGLSIFVLMGVFRERAAGVANQE